MSDTPRTLFQFLLAECEENPAGFVGSYIASQADLYEANKRIAELERGEYICKKCGLRKDAEFERGEF